LLVLGFLFVLHAGATAARHPASQTSPYVHASLAAANLHLMAGHGSPEWPAPCCLQNTCINPAVVGPTILNGRELIPRDRRATFATAAHGVLPAQTRITTLRLLVSDSARDGPVDPPVYLTTSRLRL